MNPFFTGLDGLCQMQSVQTRSISPENRTGGKGMGGMEKLENGTARNAARDLGDGWKVNPFLNIEAGETVEMAHIEGQGAIKHIWLTPTGTWRNQILRFYWDGSDVPSIECPLGDFFACGWGEYTPLVSLPICVNPGSAFNCYWTMPFYNSCRITLENRNATLVRLYYQIDYELRDLPADCGYFHAQFRRVNPLPYKQVYTLADNIQGKGQYVGTYMAWGVNNNGWWGEGEIKFYLDGDTQFPTICGTGTEDYFCGSYNFENKKERRYEAFTTPYSGLSQVILPDALYRPHMRFGMYRWHLTDPIYFERDLRVTIQALGWRSEGRYLPLQDDIASVAYWYQAQPSQSMPTLPDVDSLEII